VSVSIYSFSLPSDRCVRLLVKNLDRVMQDSVVWEDLEALDIPVQGVTPLSSSRRDSEPTGDRSLTPPPTYLYQWRGAPKCLKFDLPLNSAVCDYRWSPTWLQMARCNASASIASNTRSVTGKSATLGRVFLLPPLRMVLNPAGQPQCCCCGFNHTASYWASSNWKEAKAALA
jgi:hypothetical protein